MTINKNTQKITPFLWFEDRAEEAMELYTSLFPNSQIDLLHRWPKGLPQPENKVMAGVFTLDGCSFCAFDAGPMFKFNSSISFMVVVDTAEEIDALWEELAKDGTVLMALDEYPWSKRYGWVTDRFGLSWQLILGELDQVGQRISPCFKFSGAQLGKAEAAVNLHRSLFEDSALIGISRYPANGDGPKGLVNHAQYEIDGQVFMAMDDGTGSDVPFNEAISLYLNCRDQAEVDHYWEKLTQNGGAESHCGWLKDPYGISWQIVPQYFTDKMAEGYTQRFGQMMEILMGMKKLEVAELRAAYER